MYIRIKVKAGAAKEKIEHISSDHIDISVREKAERNMANRRVLEIVRSLFPNKPVRMVSGHHSSSKIINVEFDTE